MKAWRLVRRWESGEFFIEKYKDIMAWEFNLLKTISSQLQDSQVTSVINKIACAKIHTKNVPRHMIIKLFQAQGKHTLCPKETKYDKTFPFSMFVIFVQQFHTCTWYILISVTPVLSGPYPTSFIFLPPCKSLSLTLVFIFCFWTH